MYLVWLFSLSLLFSLSFTKIFQNISIKWNTIFHLLLSTKTERSQNICSSHLNKRHCLENSMHSKSVSPMLRYFMVVWPFVRGFWVWNSNGTACCILVFKSNRITVGQEEFRSSFLQTIPKEIIFGETRLEILPPTDSSNKTWQTSCAFKC